ncbi:MAG: acyl-CoA dehydrogenase family protein, partial [Actinomycetes bacterium]
MASPRPRVERLLPTPEAEELIGLARELAAAELAPRAAEYEAEARFPREVFRTLGRAGLLGLVYPEEHGGGGQPYEVYLQVLEELATAWLSVGIGVSVHTLACHPIARYGTARQQAELLPDMLGGELLGAYCLSEPQSGSDAAALVTKAVLEPGPDGEDSGTWVVDGRKAWITHGGVADFYALMVRTGGPGPRGISCLLADASTPGLSAATPEHK